MVFIKISNLYRQHIYYIVYFSVKSNIRLRLIFHIPPFNDTLETNFYQKK